MLRTFVPDQQVECKMTDNNIDIYMCDDCNIFPREPKLINNVLCCPSCLNPVRIPDEIDKDGWRDPVSI